MKKNKLYTVLAVTLALFALILVLALKPKASEKVSIAINIEGQADYPFSALFQANTPLDNPSYAFSEKGELRWDLVQVQPPAFKLNHTFDGYACGTFDYTFDLNDEKTELIINEIQRPTCRKEEDFYVDTLFRLPDTLQAITLNEFINDELVDSNGYLITPGVPIWPLQEELPAN